MRCNALCQMQGHGFARGRLNHGALELGPGWANVGRDCEPFTVLLAEGPALYGMGRPASVPLR